MKIYHKLALFSLDYILLFLSKTRSFKEIKLHVWNIEKPRLFSYYFGVSGLDEIIVVEQKERCFKK